jgi:glycosyltransferase involved in cell wall biosynthesis
MFALENARSVNAAGDRWYNSITNSSMQILVVHSWYPSNASDANGSFFREQAISIQRIYAEVKIGVIFPEVRSIKHLLQRLFSDKGVEFLVDEGLPTFRRLGIYGVPIQRARYVQKFVRNGMLLFDDYVAAYGLPDLIHAHCAIPAGLLARELCKKHGVRYIVSEHSSLYVSGKYSSNEKKLAECVFNDAVNLFAVSEVFMQHMRNTFPESATKWRVLPNMVSQHFLNHEHKPTTNEQFRFIFVGLLKPEKRVDVILRALKIALKERSHLFLSIVGDGSSRTELTTMVSDLNIQNHVAFVGTAKRQQVPALIADSDCLVLASDHETFGVVLTEALALGRPVISTSCGGPNSIVMDGINGFLVPIDDADSFAKAMITMADQGVKFSRREITIDCINRFGPSSIAKRTKLEYQIAIDSAKSS